jgi:hypothetical protein
MRGKSAPQVIPERTQENIVMLTDLAAPEVVDDGRQLDGPFDFGRGGDRLDDATNVHAARDAHHRHPQQGKSGGNEARLLVLEGQLQHGRARQAVDGNGEAAEVPDLVALVFLLWFTLRVVVRIAIVVTANDSGDVFPP